MKRFWGWIAVGLVVVFAAVNAIEAQTPNTYSAGTSTISFKMDRGTEQILIIPHDKSVTVRLHTNGSVLARLTVLKDRPYTITTKCDSVYILRSASTAVTLVTNQSRRHDISAAGKGFLDIADLESVTIVQNYTIPAARFETLPVPLISMGDHNYVAFSISAVTCGDTLWYQNVQGNTMMDTTTAFNFGSSGSKETLRFLLWDSDSTSFATDAYYDTKCLYLDTLNSTWKPDGIYFETVGYNVLVQNASGYSGHAKFAGIRIGTSAATGVTGLKIIAHLGTIGGVEGD